MWPYSSTQDKLMLPVAGYPLVLPLLETLQEQGFSEIYLSANGRGWTQLTQYLTASGRLGLRDALRFIEDSKLQGSAAAVAHALQQLPADISQLLVCCGDVALAPENLINFLQRADSFSGPLSMLVQPLDDAEGHVREAAGDWLCAQVAGDRVQAILGHPRGGVSHRLGGCYLLREKALSEVQYTAPYMEAIQVGMMPPQEADLAQTVANLLQQGCEVQAVVTVDYLVDVDKPWHIMEANRRRLHYLSSKLAESATTESCQVDPTAMIRGQVVAGENVQIGPGVMLEGPVWIGSNTTITRGAMVYGPVVIGDNCVVEEYCRISPYSSIGSRCQVGHCAEIDGILMDNVYAVHYMEFHGIIGRSSDLGAATVCGTLRFDDGSSSMKVEGRRETPRYYGNASYLGDFTRTGVNAILMPGVRVGAYGVVGPGVLLSEDVPDRTMVLAEQNHVRRPWGPEKYGW